MKNLLTVFCAMVVFSAGAQTTNWYVDGNLYQTTTCTSGDDVTPPTAPAKHGYTFVGWYDSDVVVGTWAQSGTPSPTNPIEPTFYQNRNLILRAIGTGGNLIADTYNAATGKITRRIGVKVLDGTENWQTFPNSGRFYLSNAFQNLISYGSGAYTIAICSHFPANPGAISGALGFVFYKNFPDEVAQLRITYPSVVITTAFKQYLADQYAAGTPVTIYYPLATPTEEVYIPAQ